MPPSKPSHRSSLPALRDAFLAFFQGKGHRIMPGISLVPTDPSLLLTGAGVVPFRAFIEGRAKPDAVRVASCQRCVRDTDTERVGRTASHLTFFEMLGNFSFGDYYKRESLLWGWEFLTEIVRLDASRIWASVYVEDEEAAQIWEREIGLPPSRIAALGMENNWWGPVAQAGACGPCSEACYDLGEKFACGRPDCGPGCSCDRFLEVWNHVFTEFYKNPDGSFAPLPTKNIDTGMGLERLAVAAQGKTTCFEIDALAPLVKQVGKVASVNLEGEMLAFARAIADHARSTSFMIMDGILPSNQGRGYVLRRLMRRALTLGRRMGIERAFLGGLIPTIAGLMGDHYTELRGAVDHTMRVVRAEEERFRTTLQVGWRRLMAHIGSTKEKGESVLDGVVAADMTTTYGFPHELTRELLAEQGLSIGEAEFEQAVKEHRERSRAEVEGYDEAARLYAAVLHEHGPSAFRGYEVEECPGTVIAVFAGGARTEAVGEGEADVILDQTPFYASAGGQVGDTGVIEGDGLRLRVLDTFYGAEDLPVHRCQVEQGTVKVGADVFSRVESRRRAAIRRNHTATHLLHYALRQVLGSHAAQMGSYVGPEGLRFDFSHYQALGEEERMAVEDVANEKVLEDAEVSTQVCDIDEARAAGAIALFGEKYGAVVRMVSVGDFSKELCGGTHVSRTGQIGLFRILSEGSIGAGVRRLEAVTGMGSLESLRADDRLWQTLAREVGASGRDDTIARVRTLATANQSVQEELERVRLAYVRSQAQALAHAAVAAHASRILAVQVEVSGEEHLQALCDELAGRLHPAVVLLAAQLGGRVALACKVSEPLTGRGVHAGNLVNLAAAEMGGKGGGRAAFARGSAKNPAGIAAGLAKALAAAQEALAR